MASLTSTYRIQGRWKEAEEEVQVWRGFRMLAKRLLSGLVGVYVTVPTVPNVLQKRDWACVAPRPNRLAEPRGALSPQGSASSCLSAKHSPYLSDRVPGAMYK